MGRTINFLVKVTALMIFSVTAVMTNLFTKSHPESFSKKEGSLLSGFGLDHAYAEFSGGDGCGTGDSAGGGDAGDGCC